MINDQEIKETKNQFIPPIILEENPQEEVELFHRGLHVDLYDSKHPWQRDQILRAFPDLHQMITTNPQNEEQILKDYLQKYHQEHQDKIGPVVEKTKTELTKKSVEALSELAQLMDYKWAEESPEYKVIPVLLPYSPFGDNVFFYSILAAVNGHPQNDALFVATHEISHMLFFEILKKQHVDMFSYSLNQMHYPLAVDYLKEILAPVLMKQPTLKKYLDFSMYPLDQWPDGYIGNDNLIQMYVTTEDMGEKMQITKYFQQLYEKMRYQENKPFSEIVEEMLRLVSPLEDELAKKRALWNKHQNGIFKDEKLLAEYSQPIKLT